MSRKATERVDPVREFDKAVERLAYRKQRWRVFADFVEMAAIALTNAGRFDRARERRYLEIVGTYESDEAQDLAKMLSLVVLGLQGEPCDFLGEAFMRLELANHWAGQFFTPIPLALLMARMTLDLEGMKKLVDERGYVTILDPCVGGGAFPIAILAAFRDLGLDPEKQLHITGVDVDPTAAHMATVQLCVLGIPAEVWIGNSLTNEYSEAFRTPRHWGGPWSKYGERPPVAKTNRTGQGLLWD